jgi:rhodanese-related sulfurtransferase
MKRLLRSFLCLMAWAGLALLPAPVLAQPWPDPLPEYWYRRLVDIEFVRPYAVIPPRDDAVLIDARDTDRRYAVGHLPGATSLPAKQFDELAPRLLPHDKDKLILFYCDGIECKLSHMAAEDAEDLGYSNIRVYVGGFPEWFKLGNPYAISAGHLKTLVEAGAAGVLVDVRDGAAYDKGHMPGALSLPAAQFEQRGQAVLPAEKSTPLVFYGDDADSSLSYAVARKVSALGYTKVMLVDGGYPAWTKLSR